MRNMIASGEFLFALAVILVGLLVTVTGSGYHLGNPTEPGPGMFPLALGILLMLLGAGLVINALNMPVSGTSLPLRPLVCVGGAVLIWSLLVDGSGFAPATIALVATSALAERRIRTVPIIILALALTTGGFVIFVHGFGMPFELFGW